MSVPLEEPFERFEALYASARKVLPKDPEAVALATVDASGRPSIRMVLLKGFSPEGFVFYTNHESRKGKELLGHKVAALCWYWPALDVQVRAEGDVAEVSAAEADAYFATRARASQLGAWASLQSQPLDQRSTLEARLEEVTHRFQGKSVPRPPHWGGFRLAPRTIEFWHAREFRLHERFAYSRAGDGWDVTLLYP
jgi:pyridoxamine 5'-phosphate oxidase